VERALTLACAPPKTLSAKSLRLETRQNPGGEPSAQTARLEQWDRVLFQRGCGRQSAPELRHTRMAQLWTDNLYERWGAHTVLGIATIEARFRSICR
jgi:hypothetical protein